MKYRFFTQEAGQPQTPQRCMKWNNPYLVARVGDPSPHLFPTYVAASHSNLEERSLYLGYLLKNKIAFCNFRDLHPSKDGV